MWKLRPCGPCSTFLSDNVNNSRHGSSGVGVGAPGFLPFRPDTSLAFSQIRTKCFRKENSYSSRALSLHRLGEPSCTSSPNERLDVDRGLPAFIWFSLVLTGRHSVVLSKEDKIRGWSLWGHMVLLTDYYPRSHWATTSTSQRSVRTCRATWIWGSGKRTLIKQVTVLQRSL